MAKMKLYYSPGSPYARKVRIVALETRLDKKIEMVNVAVSPVAPQRRCRQAQSGRQDPGACGQGHRPLRLAGDLRIPRQPAQGPQAAAAQGPRPLGGAAPAGDGRRSARCRATCPLRGCAQARGQALVRLERGPDEEDQRRAQSARGRSQGAQGQADPGLDLGCLRAGYLDFRFAASDWRSKHPKLAKWFNSFSKTPSVKATVPPPA